MPKEQRRPHIAGLVSIVVLLGLPSSASGHPAIDAQIADLTARLEREPGRADLHLRLGDLHRLHGERAAALADLERARALDPDLAEVDLSLACLLMETGELRQAGAALDRFLLRRPGQVDGLVARGRLRTRQGQHLWAADDFTRAIVQLRFPLQPAPELFLERARALASAGKERLGEALRGLDEGIERLGPLVTLESYAIDLEVRRGAIEAALARADTLAAASASPARWLARRGTILEEAGQREEAYRAFLEARAGIEALPEPRRGTPAVAALEHEVSGALRRLEPGAGGPEAGQRSARRRRPSPDGE